MILFATKHKKYHLLYTPTNQCVTNIFKVENDTLRLFFQKKLLNNLQLYLYSLLLPLEHEYYIHY